MLGASEDPERLCAYELACFFRSRAGEPRTGFGNVVASELSRTETDLARGGHGIQHAGNNLGGAGATHFVRRLCFEQFGVCEDDSELIVEAMEQQAEIGRLVRGCAGTIVGGRRHDVFLRVRSPEGSGSRQSVSPKIRTDPPAVRTYSTLPLAIQL